LTASILVAAACTGTSPGDLAEGVEPATTRVVDPTTTAPTTTAPPVETTSSEPTSTTLGAFDGWVNPASSGLAWSALGAVDGLLTFRGNPTRTFYGRGPVPRVPAVLWTFDIGCSNSSVGGEPKQWCGSGWTGQPAMFHPPGDPEGWWVAFGGYNRKVNFLDPATGAEVYPGYATDDIIKGSITIDPDGYPLLYTGSRDNNYHVVALDGPEPRVLWKLPADLVQPTKWNNDWDGSGLVIDDYLFEGGENSRFFIVKLNRGYDAQGKVTVEPQLVFSTEGWDAELISAVGNDVSIENSVAISGNTVYFANSGGLVQGWDISGLADGATPTRVFRFWTGDDTDASVVVDSEGMLYVGSEYERGNARSKGIGQIMKLDPSKPDDPLVWSREANSGLNTGVWATAALYEDLVIVPTDDGRVLGLDRTTGDERWMLRLPGPLWQSPVVVDGILIQGDCEGGLHAFDVSDTTQAPVELWSLPLTGCIESTPAVWDGRIFFGTRSGTFYAIGES
jgi:outer membrane protein assembly factor BamB